MLAEAKSRWTMRAEEDNVISVAACQILSLACNCVCKDKLAITFKMRGRQMGERLGLFGIAGSPDFRPNDRSPASDQ